MATVYVNGSPRVVPATLYQRLHEEQIIDGAGRVLNNPRYLEMLYGGNVPLGAQQAQPVQLNMNPFQNFAAQGAIMAAPIADVEGQDGPNLNDWQNIFEVATPKRATKQKVEQDPNNPRKFQDLQNYSRLNVNKTACVNYEKGRKTKAAQFSWATYQGYVGIEVEVENIKEGIPVECYWSVKTDGSLRNNGFELVSQPLAVKQIQFAVEHMYEALYKHNQPDFSNRTSVHVHVNCRDMTQDQVYNFVLLYSIFEKHFFKVAGTKRWNSIYCVPVYRCNILQHSKTVIYDFIPDYWHKYCALNLLPLIPNNNTGCYGTIEFRHLYGTANPLELMEWINDILCLRQVAIDMDNAELLEKIKELNTTSQYIGMYNMIFSNGRRVLTSRNDFEDCISHVKRELFGEEYSKTIKKSTDGEYWTLCNNLGLRG